MTRRALLLATLAAPAALAQPAQPRLRVLGTGAVEAPAHEVIKAFARETRRSVTLATGNGGQVASRIRDGEALDVVINADAALDALIAEGFLDGATRTELGRMRIGLAVRRGAPAPDIATPEALRALLLAAPAIAMSDGRAGATTGRHILAMLDRLGIAQEVEPRLRPFPRGLMAVQSVAEGQAALVMTQISEIVVVPGAALVGPLPDSLQLVTPYVAAVTKRSADPDGARAVIAALAGPAGRAAFAAAGFAVGA